VLELLAELQAETGISVLLITHDLGVVAQVCQRVAVMYCGQIVETGEVADVLRSPNHPYTIGLLGAIPRRGTRGDLRPVPGVVPPLDALPAGCRFHTRCPHALAGVCDAEPPALTPTSPTRSDRCVRRDEIADLRRSF
jgi:peptide/nickel transport system ATP-binding protein